MGKSPKRNSGSKRKMSGGSPDDVSSTVITLLTYLNQIKIYHWQTRLYSRHKSTDELYEKLGDLIDKFVETLLGRVNLEKTLNYRFELASGSVLSITNMSDDAAIGYLTSIKEFLEGSKLSAIIGKATDLQNIRDEILGEINKYAYLMTLR